MAAAAVAAARCTPADYKILETLGEGQYGCVKKAQKRDGTFVALKLVSLEGLTTLPKLLKEVKIMMACKHPNILQLNTYNGNFSYEADGTKVSCAMLELELAEGGELFSYLMSTGRFPDHIARTYFIQAIKGLYYCHKKGIAHRDIKGENLLLDKNFNLKIADFGCSAIHDTPTWLESKVGTVAYMAPEVLAGRAYKGSLADTWSIGVVLFLMLARFPPFQEAKRGDWWFDRVVMSDYDNFWRAHLRTCSISSVGQDLFNKIFVVDPAKRATLEQIYAHPWLKGKIIATNTFKAEMLRRKAVVDRARLEKKRAKQRAELLKARELMAPDGSSFNATRSTLRSSSLGCKKDASWAKYPKALPVPVGGVSHFTSFYVQEHPKEIEDRLLQCLSKQAAEKQTFPGYKITATVGKIGGISVTIQIYADGGNHVVELRRRHGDMIKFMNLYNSICDDLADIMATEDEDEDEEDEILKE